MNKNNHLLMLNFNKNIESLNMQFYIEKNLKLTQNYKYEGFVFNNLLKLTLELKNNDFNYFPKLKLQKLNKFDKSRSEIQNYIKELFFNENPEYLDLDIMEEDIKSIQNLKLLVNELNQSQKEKEFINKEELMNLRWYLKENNEENFEDKTSDKFKMANKSNITKDNSNWNEKVIINEKFNLNENNIINYYDNITSYFKFLIKFFEISLTNSLNNPEELLENFNKIYTLYSKLIIVLDEILKPINELINKNFNESFKNFPKYPKYNYFKYLMRIFYNDFYLTSKLYLDKAFFKWLKNKRNSKLNKFKKEVIKNDQIENNYDSNKIDNLLKNYVIFLEDISYNEVNVNYNCYSKLNSENDIEIFKKKFVEKTIKLISNNWQFFIKNPSFINTFFKLELSFLSNIVLENFYLNYVIKIGTFFLKTIKEKLIIIMKNNSNKYIKNKTKSNIKRILLKTNFLDYFLINNLNNILSNNFLSLNELESDISFNEINNSEYLYDKNIDNFQVLVNEFEILEKFCDNILFKIKENDDKVIEFNKKRGIPLEWGNKKELYDLVSNLKKNNWIKKNIENLFIYDNNSFFSKTNCSFKLEENLDDNKIKNDFKLPGYEEIISDFDESFEELTL